MSDESVPQHPSPHRTLHHVSDMLFGETTTKFAAILRLALQPYEETP